VTDERRVVVPDDVLTCEPNYEDKTAGTTSGGFNPLQTGLSFPVAIQIPLGDQTIQMKVASDAPPNSVEARARVQFGQNVGFVEPKPTAWVSNKKCQMQKTTEMRFPVISASTRVNLDLVIPGVEVAITMCVGDIRIREKTNVIPGRLQEEMLSTRGGKLLIAGI
jgi:hypothetical protein